MPIYVHLSRDPARGCATCRTPFETILPLGRRLRRCPDCRGPVDKQVAPVNAAFPQGPAQLRNLGFARLEKRSDGSYENVSAQPGAQKHGSLESFSKSLSKGPKPIVRD